MKLSLISHRAIDCLLGAASFQYARNMKKPGLNCRFDEIIGPVVRILPAEPGLNPDLVRVELSPRIEEGLVRDVSVRSGRWRGKVGAALWGRGRHSKFPSRSTGTILPEKGRTTSLNIDGRVSLSDADQAAHRFTPDELTATCRVEATSDGIHMVPWVGRPGPEIICRATAADNLGGYRRQVTK